MSERISFSQSLEVGNNGEEKICEIDAIYYPANMDAAEDAEIVSVWCEERDLMEHDEISGFDIDYLIEEAKMHGAAVFSRQACEDRKADDKIREVYANNYGVC